MTLFLPTVHHTNNLEMKLLNIFSIMVQAAKSRIYMKHFIYHFTSILELTNDQLPTSVASQLS